MPQTFKTTLLKTPPDNRGCFILALGFLVIFIVGPFVLKFGVLAILVLIGSLISLMYWLQTRYQSPCTITPDDDGFTMDITRGSSEIEAGKRRLTWDEMTNFTMHTITEPALFANFTLRMVKNWFLPALQPANGMAI